MSSSLRITAHSRRVQRTCSVRWLALQSYLHPPAAHSRKESAKDGKELTEYLLNRIPPGCQWEKTKTQKGKDREKNGNVKKSMQCLVIVALEGLVLQLMAVLMTRAIILVECQILFLSKIRLQSRFRFQ